MTRSHRLGHPAQTLLLLLLLCVAPLSLAACGSSGETTNVREDTTPREGYPAGPYGKAEGNVIEDLSFLAPDGAAFSFQSNIHANGGNKLMLVSTSAGWCTACIEEQPKLESLHDEFFDQGLAVVVTVFEDSQFNDATVEDAAEWKSKYNLSFDVVADPGFVFETYYDAQLTPMSMIVDVETMEILRLNTGFDESTVRAIIESRL